MQPSPSRKQPSPSRKKAALFVTLVVSSLVMATGALARGPAESDASGDHVERKLAHMERMVRERLSPRLELDGATEDELVRLFQESARERHTARQAAKKERDALQALVDKSAPEPELSAQLQRVYAAMEKVPSRGALLDKTAAVLSTEQQAKLVLSGPQRGHGERGMHGKRGKAGKGGMRGVRGVGDGRGAGAGR